MSSPVSSHNEWDPLEEIIVGSARLANIPPRDISMRNFTHPNGADARPEDTPPGPVADWIVEETEEDIDGFVAVLEDFGATVRRPAPYDNTRPYATPEWQAEGFHSIMPRDCLNVFGSIILEAPMSARARYYEAWAFKDILIDYSRRGATWLSAPKPRLPDETYLLENKPPDTVPVVAEIEPLFDAANIFRCGRDIFFNVNNTGNMLGLTWLRNLLGDGYRVHPISVSWDHTDTTIVPLRPGTVLINPSRIDDANFPEAFKAWDVIQSPTPQVAASALGWVRGSEWIGMNVLSLDERHVIVDSEQPALMRTLSRHGFEPIPVRHRHARTFGGGFHCITCDTRRAGGLEGYF